MQFMLKLLSSDAAFSRVMLTRKTTHWACHAVLALIVLNACSFQQYQAKAINTADIATKIESKNPDGPAFQAYLHQQGYAQSSFPIQQWDVDALVYCALFFHPNLEVARAKWRATQAIEQSAAEKATPTLNSQFAHSNNANQDISPYALGLGIDIPIETANKRDIRIAHARHQTQIAELEVAQTAWQLRQLVVQVLINIDHNQQQIQLLTQVLALKTQIVAMLQKRVTLGLSSNVELSIVKLQEHAAFAELQAAKQRQSVLLAELANHLGLPLSKVALMSLQPYEDYLAHLPALNTTQNSSATALLNRLDIRIALAQYAVAETKLKLEIAKQYPDLSITPGYAYEFGNQVWSLGISGLLTLLNKNKLAIAEATQLREVEAAQFEVLQHHVIAEVSTNHAKLAQAQQDLAQQTTLYQQQAANTNRMNKKFTAGEIDKLELSFAKLEQIEAEKNLLSAKLQRNHAIYQLENILQKPLADTKQPK